MGTRVDVASSSDDITGWLARWNEGDEAALEKVVPLVYQELHRLASRYMRGERSEHLLQTTALVNEAYLRLHETNGIHWHDRNHFYAVAARAMRRVLVAVGHAAIDGSVMEAVSREWPSSRRTPGSAGR